MPGLCGIIDLSASASDARGTAVDQPRESDRLLARMIEVLSHDPRYRCRLSVRGPGLALAVVGYPSTCHRPLVLRAGTVTEIWYGEIYDGLSVHPGDGARDVGASASSDGEALDLTWDSAEEATALRPPEGASTGELADTLAGVSGTFAGIRIDAAAGTFALFTDVIAAIPLFVRRQGRFLLFAPEPKALVIDGLPMPAGDPATLGFFLAAGFVPPGRSHFQGVTSLPAASIYTGRTRGEGSHAVSTYWDFVYRAARPASDETTMREELAETLRRVIGSQLADGERIGVLLSGGYDSRGILGAAMDRRDQITGVTWGADPELPGSDAVVARQLAAAAGVPHRFLPLDVSHLPSSADRWVWMVDGQVDALENYPEGDQNFQLLARDFAVLIRGDECFGMKWPYGVPDDHVARACIGVYPFAWHSIFDRLLTNDACQLLGNAMQGVYDTLGERVLGRHPRDRKDEYYFKVRFRSYLNPLNYFKLQMLPMRNPLLDRRVMELVLRWPREVRQSKRLFRYVVENELAPFADVPFATRTNLVQWQGVAATTPALGSFFRERLLDAPPTLSRWIDRTGLEKQLNEWLAPPSNAPTQVTERRALRELATRWGKRVAYHPATPATLRRRLLPARNVRRGFDYAFRLLVLAIYFERLESEGKHVRWDVSP